MLLAILFHLLCAQHVSDINISFIRSLRLCCWITTSVVLVSVRCVLETWCGWFWVVFVLQAEAQVVLYFCKTLYMFEMVFPSIIRSSKCTYSIRHLSDHCCYLLLAWARWNECLMLYVQFWAPDDGRKTRLKHAELLTEINKLRNVASCWLHFGNAQSRISVRLRQLQRKGKERKPLSLNI